MALRLRWLWLVTFVLLAFGVPGCSADAATDETVAADGAELWNGPDTFGMNLQDAEGLDFGNAYWMARLSAIAYEEPAEAKAQLAALKIENIELLFFENRRTDTQAMYLGFADGGILAFRGTEPMKWKDWFSDALAYRTDTRVGGIHKGFYTAFTSIWEDDPQVTVNGERGHGIATYLRRRHARSSVDPDGYEGVGTKGKPLFFTGHSLGGALATIAATHSLWDSCLRERPATDPFWQARRNDLRVRPECELRGIETTALYTFGSPRSGDVDFNLYGNYKLEENLGHGISVFRFVNSNDLVARVPDSGFIHACQTRTETAGLIYLPTAGAVDVGGKSNEFLHDPSRAKLLERVGDHGLDLYAKKLLQYAGRAAPPPVLSVRRAANERMKAAFLAPVRPSMLEVGLDDLKGEVGTEFGHGSINGGTRTGYAWIFEGKTIYLFEDNYSVDHVDDANVVTGSSKARSYLFLNDLGEKLIAASGDVDDSSGEEWLSWYDFEDGKSVR